jgi:hypothetical protein
MGISREQFFATSQNGKAMVLMIAQRGDVEMARNICEWLVDERERGLRADLKKQGRLSEEAQKIAARDAVAGIRAVAESINDRNVVDNTTRVIDHIFQRAYSEGQQVYARHMLWFANELRKRVTDDK